MFLFLKAFIFILIHPINMPPYPIPVDLWEFITPYLHMFLNNFYYIEVIEQYLNDFILISSIFDESIHKEVIRFLSINSKGFKTILITILFPLFKNILNSWFDFHSHYNWELRKNIFSGIDIHQEIFAV